MRRHLNNMTTNFYRSSKKFCRSKTVMVFVVCSVTFLAILTLKSPTNFHAARFSQLQPKDSVQQSVQQSVQHVQQSVQQSVQPHTHCNYGCRPQFVLGMLTPHTHVDFRNGQRSTWISTMQQLKEDLPFVIVYKFLIDLPTNNTVLENEKYDDIVFLNATSQGRAVKFGEKLYLWFKYIHEHFPDALLGAKVDDDTFLCVQHLFKRLDELKSRTLYYGWTHGSGKRVNIDTRMDEMFVVLGKDLIERIAKRKYCNGTKCDAKSDLIDTNYGGTSLGSWLSIYPDIDYQPDNTRIVHVRWTTQQLLRNIKPDFCSKYVLHHKASVDAMEMLHRYNKQAMPSPTGAFSKHAMPSPAGGYNTQALPSNSPAGFVGAVTGSLFSGDIVRALPQKTLTNRHKYLAQLDQMSACDSWAVVTTIFSPAKAVKDIASHPDWCLVIVADAKTPPGDKYLSEMGLHETSTNRIKYLSLKEQGMLYPLLSGVIPINHFGRKNIGYMYAIHHNAKYIWDFDDDNIGTVDLSDIKADGTSPYVTACRGGHHTLLNPYPYFGVNETHTWPRGFPLEDIKNNTTFPKLCNTSDSIQIGIVQSLANRQPDIDAIYRMTRDAPFDFLATRQSHRLFVLPRYTYAPINAQATLWLAPAFPYMALPISVNGRVSDIWRGYVAQHFLHRKDVRLAFSPPYVIQERNAHDILRDFNAELDLYQKSKQLVVFLSSPKSGNPADIIEMYKNLYKRKYIEQLDIQFAEAWAKTLASIN